MRIVKVSGLDFRGVGPEVFGWPKRTNLEKYGQEEVMWMVRL